MKNYKDIFTQPTEEEQKNIRDIFITKNFTKLLNKRELLKGGLFADPFVIAKAMSMENGIVVTREKSAKVDKKGNIQGAPKIPDICKHFDINCLSPEDFMKKEQWRF